jgi:hypothetical protein
VTYVDHTYVCKVRCIKYVFVTYVGHFVLYSIIVINYVFLCFIHPCIYVVHDPISSRHNLYPM